MDSGTAPRTATRSGPPASAAPAASAATAAGSVGSAATAAGSAVGSEAGRTALVTGASRGLGRSLAEGLATAGFRVGLVARDEARLAGVADALGDHTVVAVADVTDAEQVAAAVAKVERSFGPIDLLVNNAGIADTDELPVWESDPAQWWHVVETNLRGPYLFSRAVLPGLRDRGGRIVNITGMVDHAVPGYSSYCVAKAALARLTESLAQDGVRAFDVAPGLIRTELTTAMPMLRDAPADTYGSIERLIDFVLAIAAGRLDRLAGRYFHAQRDRLDDLDAGLDGRRLRMTAG